MNTAAITTLVWAVVVAFFIAAFNWPLLLPATAGIAIMFGLWVMIYVFIGE